MYPLKFNNIYENKIWGGRDLEEFRSNLPSGKIGESFDIVSREDRDSIIINGEFKGEKLSDILKKYKGKIVGNFVNYSKFPLIVKIINAKLDLSLQVHPDDEYAKANENSFGKTEAWYILRAKENAKLIIGLKDEKFKNEVLENVGKGEMKKYLKEVNVKEGEVYLIESGLIHSIGKGITLIEIQQNSDLTYRIYDFERERELHLEKAKDVINFGLNVEKIVGASEKYNDCEITKYIDGKHFILEKIKIDNALKEKSDVRRFYIYTCVNGSGSIIYKNKSEKLTVGESVLIPATLGEYTIEGKLEVLKYYVKV